MARRRKSTLRNHFDWNDKLFMHFMRCYRISFALASPFWRSEKRTIIRFCFVICHAWIRYLCLLGVKCYFATILYWQGDGCIDEIHWSAEKKYAQTLIRSRMRQSYSFFLFSIYSIFVRCECRRGMVFPVLLKCATYCFQYVFIHSWKYVNFQQPSERKANPHRRNESERTYTQFV